MKPNTVSPFSVSRVRPLRLGHLSIIVLSLFLAGAEAGNGFPNRAQVASASVDQLLREGLQAYRDQQLPEALAKLKQAYQLDSRNLKVRLALGLMLYESDPASHEAQQLMESVAPQFPGNFELQLKLMDSYLQLKNESPLPALLRRLGTVTAANNRAAFDVIYTLVRYGRLELAQSQLNQVSSRLQPKIQGLTEQELKSPARRELMRDAGEIHFINGLVAASRENKTEAMRLFQAADRYDFPPPDSLQMQMLAEALFRFGEYPLSAQAYETYLRNFPLDAEARLQLALSYYSNASFANAKTNFLKVREQNPQTVNVNLYLGLISLEQKNNEEARGYFQEELKLNRQSYQAMAELAYLDYLGGNNESCRQWLEKARALSPDWLQTNMVFGLLYNRLGQFERAIESLERAVKEKPNYYKAHYQLSLAYRRTGNALKAKQHADIYEQLIAQEKSRQLGSAGVTSNE